jgi:MFS transporter, OFA family, oxalate/formate antiporter
MELWGWSNSEVAWVFSLAICFLGFAAAWGGMRLARIGPRRLAVTGGALFGLGYLVGGYALKVGSLPLLYVGYGVCGGIGLGLGYVTPVATVAKWFPEQKGLLTGMVIMGFGFGALLMSKVLLPGLLAATEGDLAAAFGWLGAGFGLVSVGCGCLLRNPPVEGRIPDVAGQEDAVAAGETANEADPGGLLACVRSRRFCVLWAVFFCNIVAGISIIGFQSPLLQDLMEQAHPGLSAAVLAAAGASLIAASSVCNGVGRLLWGGLSDRIGRMRAFRLILGSQILVFLALGRVSQPWLFSGLVCYVLLCYGGGFGTMPALVTDLFGARLMPVVYGFILTAWSAAGIVGPQVVAWMKDEFGGQAAMWSFPMGAAILGVGLLLSFDIRNRQRAP